MSLPLTSMPGIFSDGFEHPIKLDWKTFALNTTEDSLNFPVVLHHSAGEKALLKALFQQCPQFVADQKEDRN